MLYEVITLSKDYSLIITRIREIIYRQKFEGAAAGFLNSSIIARDLGLQDKQQLEHSGEIIVKPPVENAD